MPIQRTAWSGTLSPIGIRAKPASTARNRLAKFTGSDRHPAVLSPDRVAKQWNQVPAEQLPKIFETYLPVCWNCCVAETFRQQNPDRVVNRNWERGAAGEYVPKEAAKARRRPLIRKRCNRATVSAKLSVELGNENSPFSAILHR
jgi:hypothetical protein